MPYCKNCGNELPEGAQFCPKCGTAVTKLEEPVVVAAPVPPVAAPELNLAFWGERFVAWLIDVVLIGAVFLHNRFIHISQRANLWVWCQAGLVGYHSSVSTRTA